MAPTAASDPGFSRLPPQNIEAEQSVLGAVLLDNAVLPRVIEILQPEDFYRGSHRRIFAAMLDMFERDQAIDLITLRERLEQKNQLEEIGGAVYLASLVDQVPTAANVAYHAKIVREKAMMRGLITASTEIAAMSYEGSRDVEQVLDEAERRIFTLSERSLRDGFVPMREVVKESFKVLEKLFEKKDQVTGVASGFTDLDQLTCGFQPSDLVIIAGRPSMGKTAFVLNIAEHVGLEAQGARGDLLARDEPRAAGDAHAQLGLRRRRQPPAPRLHEPGGLAAALARRRQAHRGADLHRRLGGLHGAGDPRQGPAAQGRERARRS